MSKKVLVIDGDYMANSILGFMNSGERSCPLNTRSEREEFRVALNKYFIGFIEKFKPLIDNVVVVKDNKSWRKHITPPPVYYQAATTGYKENRKDKKDESPTNYVAFHEVYAEFFADISTMVQTITVPGLEGDDCIYLLSKEFEKHGLTGICLHTDGDIEQTCNDNFLLYKNVKSKESPNGVVYISAGTYTKIFESTPEEQLLNGVYSELAFYHRLFGISMKSATTVSRAINEGLHYAKPHKSVLIKVICGDEKDNILPLFRWFTPAKKFAITEKMLEKSFMTHLKMVLTDANARIVLTDKDVRDKLLKGLIVDMQKPTDLTTPTFDGILTHFKHNLNMKLIHHDFMPDDSVDAFDIAWQKQILPSIQSLAFDMDHLVKLDVNSKDSGMKIVTDSLPTGW